MKARWVLTLAGLMLMLGIGACAMEARDISAQAVFTGDMKQNLPKLTDRNYNSYWRGRQGKGTLTITSQEPVHGLYICWRQEPRAFRIEAEQNGRWETVAEHEEQTFVHQYYALDGYTSLRLVPIKDNGKEFAISELFLLGEGELPGFVQRWEPTIEDADLMLLFAHPDDEVLFFGGTLPYYAGERGLKVLPVCLTKWTDTRRHELLNCLWLVGIRNYPVVGPFTDVYAKNLDAAYQRIVGRRRANEFITTLLRRHKPEVLVSHDVGGEYGHGAHMLCADIAKRGVQYAADPARSPDSYEAYGSFQVQKLYLHMYKERGRDVQLTMDWDQPLQAFQGRTGYEMAVLGYQEHVSQHRYEQYKVEPRDSRRSSYLFGLAFSMVGDDVAKNDFFEHIPLPVQP